MKAILCLFGLFLLTGCAESGLPTNPIYSNASAMQLSPVATGTPSPTITATATPTATPINFGDLPITQTALALGEIALNQEAQKINLQLTQKAIDDENAGRTATWAAPTETKAAEMTQTPAAAALATARMSQTQTPEAIANKKDAAEAERVEKFNQGIPVLVGVTAVMIVLVGFFVAAFLRAGIKAKQEERRLYQQSNQRSEPVADSLAVKLDQRDAYNYGAVNYTNCPLDKKTLMAVATLIVEHGARYTQAQMTGAGKPLVKDGNYDTFGAWMVANKIAMQFEDGRYQIEHPEFFKQVLGQ
jgi:hypothetical protein